MLSEDSSTKCPSCKNPLIWLSHFKRDQNGAEEFRFSCDTCKQEYAYSDGRLTEKRKERDAYAESAAMARSERDTVLNHRCPRCGGPISDGAMSPMLVCLWCGEEYAVKNGELVSKLEDHLLMRPKRQMREFYTIQPKR